MGAAKDAWNDLSLPWQVAFDEAWASFRAGNFGIGAVLADPAAGDAIITAGRDRVNQQQRVARTLSGNMMAHAEMNAMAELDTFNAEGLDLYTTLEPCLMCAATAMLLKVSRVHYAADDEFFEGINDLWVGHPVTAERRPERTGPLGPELAAFARLLPMIFTFQHFAGSGAEQLARETHPGLAQLVDDLESDETWASIAKSGTAHRALGHLWDRLAPSA